MIVVSGATGTVGRELVAELARRQAKVRALSRDPSHITFPPDVQAVAADLASPQTLGPALAGAEKVFILANGPDRLAHETNLVAAARQAGAARLVKLSALAVEDCAADDLITGWQRAAEQAVTASGLPWTILRPGAFMSNTLAWAPMIRHQGRIFTPYAQVRHAAVDPADIAAAAAAVLLGDGHDGRTYPQTGPEPVSAADQARILGVALGRQVGVTEISAEAARDQMIQRGTPARVADAVLAILARAGTGSGGRVLPTVAELTGQPARTFSAWATRHIAAFRPAA